MRLRPLAALCLAVLAALAATDAASRAAPQQSVPSGTQAASLDELLASAEKLLDAQKGFAAQPLFERALEEATRLSRDAEEARARVALGEILYYRTQYDAAREQSVKALAMCERLDRHDCIGRAAHVISMIDAFAGRHVDARAFAERAIAAFDAINDRRGRAMATLQLVTVLPPESVARSQSLFARAVEDAEAIGDLSIQANALHGLGDDLFNKGQFEEALDVLTRAEAVASRASRPSDLVELGTIYNSIGRVYRAHGRFDLALKSQLKALELHEKAQQPFELLQSLNAVATVYHRLGDARNAQTYYERALALAEKSSSQRVQDFMRANFAGLLLGQGQFSRGASILEQVLANNVDPYPNRRYESLSYAYLKTSRPREALDAASKAVEHCARSENTCVNALNRRALAHSALGDRQAALADVNTALGLMEDVRRRLVPLDFFKQEFHHAQEEIYSLAIRLQLEDKQDRLALETAELARSRAFLDLLASRDVRFKEKDQGTLASLRETRAPVAEPIALARETKPAPLTLRTAGEAVSTRIVPTATLELRSMVTAAPSAAADLVATAARLGSTLLAYWVGEDEISIWVVGPDGTVESRRVSVLRTRLHELIRATAPFAETDAAQPGMRAITTRGSSRVSLQNARATAWHELYDLLIAPVRSVLPRSDGALVTIVPHGPLLNVSFAALQSPRGRYLLEDYTLHYAPAGAVLQFTAPKKRADARTGSMLVVADPALPRLTTLDRPLPRLPGARGEAAQIAKLVPASRLTVLQDGVATETRARDAVGGKAVLHFATHAIVRDDDPFASFLALGPSASGGADGLLTSQEVYGLDLSADLVVLSACRSAGGSVTGDGISAFARAFIYAGTASLIASLWDVADEPTNRLLPDFYRQWLAGQSKARALRGAQLRLLRDLRAGRVTIDTPAGVVSIPEHPVFWAGFALFGEPE